MFGFVSEQRSASPEFPPKALGTPQKAPGLRRGLMLKQQGSAYRLTWTLVPPPGAPAPSRDREATLKQLNLPPQQSPAIPKYNRLS